MAAGLKGEWHKVLTMHNQNLVERRTQMEAVRTGGAFAPDLFSKGTTIVADWKKDQKDLNALLTMREKATSKKAAVASAR